MEIENKSKFYNCFCHKIDKNVLVSDIVICTICLQ